MANAPRLSESEIESKLRALPDWSESGGVIQRTYLFKDFLQSMKFVNLVAELAERRQHHPDVLIRWNKVTLSLSTHDSGGITQKDFDLATECDGVKA
jgi:4a-hydroxytetrahydrobiopterin dehydratase